MSMPPEPGYGYGPTPPVGAPYGGAAPGPVRNGLGIAALVLGLLAVITFWTAIGGVLLGLAAIVCGVIGRKRAKRGVANNGGMALAGIILGTLALLASAALIAAGVSVLNSDSGKSLRECLESAGGDQAAREQCQREFEDDVTR